MGSLLDRPERQRVAREVAITWSLASESNLVELLAIKRARVRERAGGFAGVTASDRRKAVDALQTLTKGALSG